jgi:hypothetical protein
MRQINRMATEIRMEELDAEDSMPLGHSVTPPGPLEFYATEDLVAELARRFPKAPDASVMSRDPQNLYGLAASTNSEHLEDDDDDHDGEPADS